MLDCLGPRDECRVQAPVLRSSWLIWSHGKRQAACDSAVMSMDTDVAAHLGWGGVGVGCHWFRWLEAHGDVWAEMNRADRLAVISSNRVGNGKPD